MDVDETIVGSGGAPEERAEPGWPEQTPDSSRVGRYVIVQRIGRGAMGEVFAAYDPELDRKVAVKLLHQSRSTEKARKQMVREAQALAKLTHPNVVTVHDVGKHHERVFIAMEFVEGTTLTDWVDMLEDGPQRWRKVLEVFRGAGEGLAAAHGAGIVHRDFKPDNVLVAPDGRARVADFGLALPVSDPDEDPSAHPTPTETARTDPGGLVGTPAYMSPEQFGFRAPGSASDQFSFCVALYEALFEQRPFDGKNTTALMMSVLAGDLIDPPSDTDVPARVRRAVMRGLSVDPEDRWPSMADLVAALTPEPPRRRSRVPLVAAAGFATALGAVVVVQAGDEPGCEKAGDLAERMFTGEHRRSIDEAFDRTGASYATDTKRRVVERLEYYAAAWSEIHEDACTDHSRGVVSDVLLDRKMECLQRRQREFDSLVGVLVAADADVVRNSISATQGLGSLMTCEDADALELAYDPPPPAIAEEVDAQREALVEVRTLYRAGRWDDARARAESVAQRAAALDYRPLRVEAGMELGRAQETLGDYDGAKASLDSAWHEALAIGYDQAAVEVAILLVDVTGYRLELREAADQRAADAAALLERIDTRTAKDKRMLEAQLLQARARTELRVPDFEPAGDYLRQAHEIVIEVHGEDSLEAAASLRRLGVLEAARRRPDDAVPLLEQSLAIMRRHLGESHPEIAGSLNNLALTYKNQGRREEAARAFEEAAALVKEQLGPRHPTTHMIWRNLANTYRSSQDQPKAIDAYRRWEESVPVDGVLDPATLVLYAGSLHELDRDAEAASKLELGIDIAADLDADDRGRTYVAVASYYENTEELEPALVFFEKAIEAIEDSTLDTQDLSRACLGTARVLWRRNQPGDRRRALGLATRAREVLDRSAGDATRHRELVDEWLAGLPPDERAQAE